MCEEEHQRFEPEEIDSLRERITDPAYWKCEAQHLRETLNQYMWEKILNECCSQDVSGTNDWRRVVGSYNNLLSSSGLPLQEVRESRFSIKDQNYWQPEAELLRETSALRENEMREKYFAKKNIATLQSQVKQQTRRGRRTQPTEPPQTLRISDRTRSKTKKATQPGVEKRSGKVGTKSRQP